MNATIMTIARQSAIKAIKRNMQAQGLRPAHIDGTTCHEASGDEAIAACTRAINSGRFRGHELAVIYYNRGIEYDEKGDYDRAIADYNVAIRLDPKYTNAYNNRGNAYRGKGDNNRAIADYNEEIRLKPKEGGAYHRRGVAYLYSGNPAKALADVSQASELDPKSAYLTLWVDIVGRRNNVPSRLSQAVSTLDMTVWPAPVVRMFLGQMTPAAVLAAADDPNARTKKEHICQANFFSGELALRTGAKDEATRLFRVAANDCPLYFLIRFAAKGELMALGVAP